MALRPLFQVELEFGNVASIDIKIQIRDFNIPVPVTRTAKAPTQATVVFSPSVEYWVASDFLELESCFLDVCLLQVNFQLRVGLKKSEIYCSFVP